MGNSRSTMWIVGAIAAVVLALGGCGAVAVLFGLFALGQEAAPPPPPPPPPPKAAALPAPQDPARACDFLASLGLAGRGWKLREGTTFGCASGYKELTGEPLANNLAYYGEGSRAQVEKLWITLNVNDPRDVSDAKDQLLTAAEMLSGKVIGDSLPDAQRSAIRNARSAKPHSTAKGYSVKVSREEFATGKGFSLRITFVL